MRERLVTEARTWLRTPWKHQGRLKHVGVDCLGILGMSALACGVAGAREWRSDPSMHNYGRVPQEAFLLASCDRFMDRIPTADATIGDVLVMAFRRYPQHFAMISTYRGDRVIHAYSSIGEVVENGVNVANARVLYAYRFKGIE
jgi:cell wall-associated NlpC family hydrolase